MSEEQYPVAPAAPPISHGRAQSIATLMLGAIGVVYGDIGTSPLYAFKECFSGTHPLPADAEHVLGVLSLVFWSVTIVVSFKYTMLMMRADHLGQGGSLALLALVEVITRKTWLAPVVTVLGIFAAALFYGDSMITPAISVLSAVEGLEVALPGVERFIIPITVAILVFLFMIQASGTARIARFCACYGCLVYCPCGYRCGEYRPSARRCGCIEPDLCRPISCQRWHVRIPRTGLCSFGLDWR